MSDSHIKPMRPRNRPFDRSSVICRTSNFTNNISNLIEREKKYPPNDRRWVTKPYQKKNDCQCFCISPMTLEQSQWFSLKHHRQKTTCKYWKKILKNKLFVQRQKHKKITMSFLASLVALSLISSVLTADQLTCGPWSTCKNRCYEKLVIDDIRDVDVGRSGGDGRRGERGGAGSRLEHLRCRCDHLCFFYDDCCEDFTDLCPSKDYWGRWKLVAQQKYLSCERTNNDEKSRRGLMVVGK